MNLSTTASPAKAIGLPAGSWVNTAGSNDRYQTLPDSLWTKPLLSIGP
jgi:hypothetical protein